MFTHFEGKGSLISKDLVKLCFRVGVIGGYEVSVELTK